MVALLRGINVGGRTTLPMAKLRDVAEGLGYEEVTTYIQSGNLVLRTGSSASKVEEDLARALGRIPEHRVVSDGRLVVQSNNEGVPFVLASPDAPVSRDVVRVATEVLASARVPAGARR